MEIQSLGQMYLGTIKVLVLLVGLHRCSRFPCCMQILRFESCSQTTFRWLWKCLDFRDSCCKITSWHTNNLAADGSGRKEFQVVVLNCSVFRLRLGVRLNAVTISLWLLTAFVSLSDLGHDESFHIIVLLEPMNVVVWKWHFPFLKCFAEEVSTSPTPEISGNFESKTKLKM